MIHPTSRIGCVAEFKFQIHFSSCKGHALRRLLFFTQLFVICMKFFLDNIPAFSKITPGW